MQIQVDGAESLQKSKLNSKLLILRTKTPDNMSGVFYFDINLHKKNSDAEIARLKLKEL